MTTLTIRGSSDDIVEFGGDFREEVYPADTDDFLIVASDGTALRGEYDNDGMWRFKPLATGAATMTKVEADDPDDNYSDVVTLEGDLAWVALATDIAKRNK